MNDNMQILSYIYIRELNNTPHTNIYAKDHTPTIYTQTLKIKTLLQKCIALYTHINTTPHAHTLYVFQKSVLRINYTHTVFSLSLSFISSPMHLYYLFRLLIISTYESCLAHIRLLEYGMF